MKLTKTIPSRKKTVTFLWVQKDYLRMGEKFRKARIKLKRKMKGCWWCDHKFVDGEMMAIACAEKHGNELICQKCADELFAQVR